MSELQATCDGCGDRVEPGTGFLRCPIERFQRVENAHETFPDGFALEELQALPGRASWTVIHMECLVVDAESNTYEIPIEEVLTLAGLLRWAAQLGDKTWLQYTDWYDLLRKVADGVDERLRSSS